jgi:thiol-disulfide isomerase/thioredoxin
MKSFLTNTFTVCVAIVLGLSVGCDGPRTNRFAATPVSRSLEPSSSGTGSVGLGSVDSDSNLDRSAPSVSSALRRADPRDRYRDRCEAELRGQSSYPFDFRVRSLAGRTLSKRQFAGRLLVVDVWATWCGPCVREVPHFIDLQTRYRDQGLSMVGINYERGASDHENRRHVESIAREAGINYPLALGDSQITDQIPEFRGFPTTLFIDGRGNVRLTLRGSRSHAELETFVQLLLADPSIDPDRASHRPSEGPSKPAAIQTNPFAS